MGVVLYFVMALPATNPYSLKLDHIRVDTRDCAEAERLNGTRGCGLELGGGIQRRSSIKFIADICVSWAKESFDSLRRGVGWQVCIWLYILTCLSSSPDPHGSASDPFIHLSNVGTSLPLEGIEHYKL